MAASATDGAGEAPAAAREESEKKEPSESKSLEEIQEMHLRDSFWSVS
jgi:hypothetical protein